MAFIRSFISLDNYQAENVTKNKHKLCDMRTLTINIFYDVPNSVLFCVICSLFYSYVSYIVLIVMFIEKSGH